MSSHQNIAWRDPHKEPPEMGTPVIGWHPDWVDPDFCPNGTRECFRFGDGTEWQSAMWWDEQDDYRAEDGAPTLWCHYPDNPEASSQESKSWAT